MTPGFQATFSRLEGQWWNLFRRIHWIRRYMPEKSGQGNFLIAPKGRSNDTSEKKTEIPIRFHVT
jgi:hypothetical protein